MFWKKKKAIPKHNFKLGDVIKFKEGIVHDLNGIEDISDWQARIIEVKETELELELDSITLKSLDKVYIDICCEKEQEPHILIFPFEDLELAQARDQEKDVLKAQDLLLDKIGIKNKVPKYKRLYDRWVRHFLKSEQYNQLEENYKEHTEFVLDSFLNYMYDYGGKTPQKWNIRSIKEVLLHYIPTKITAKKEMFEAYGEVLIAYFSFLQEKRYLGTKTLQQLIFKIKNEIVERSQDTSSWGPAKVLAMKAMNSGVDMGNEKALRNFFLKEQAKSLLGFGRKK